MKINIRTGSLLMWFLNRGNQFFCVAKYDVENLLSSFLFEDTNF
jgi:predicted Na+-dependent transporter